MSDTCADCDTVTALCGNCSKQATNCTSCQSGYFLSGPDFGTCATSCPNPIYPLKDIENYKCVDTCKDNLILASVNGTDVCTLCPVGQFKWVSDLGCHANCAAKYY